MQLEIHCTWDNQTKKTKQIICFDFSPKKLFSMPQEKIELLRALSVQAPQEGPPFIEKIRNIYLEYPKSLYAACLYYQTLEYFEYEEELKNLLKEIQKKFPKEALTKCILAKKLLEKKEYEKFFSFFQGIPVLKGVFPHRKTFFFEEALVFHALWARYFHEIEDLDQSEKHQKMGQLIVEACQKAKAQ